MGFLPYPLTFTLTYTIFIYITLILYYPYPQTSEKIIQLRVKIYKDLYVSKPYIKFCQAFKIPILYY